MRPDEFRTIRLTMGLTQAQLADLLGYAHTATVAAFETDPAAKSNRTIPPLLVRLMRAYEAGYRPKDWPGRDQPLNASLTRLQGR